MAIFCADSYSSPLQKSDYVSIPRRNGDGTFDPPSHIGEGWETFSVATGDFNGDGHQDLAAGNRLDGNVSIFIGIGDGSFEYQKDYPAGNWPHSVTVGDFNRDRHQDLAVANRTDATVSILLGNGDGTFLSPEPYEVGLWPVSIAVGHFNKGRVQGLAVANREDDTVSKCGSWPTILYLTTQMSSRSFGSTEMPFWPRRQRESYIQSCFTIVPKRLYGRFHRIAFPKTF